MHVFAVGEPQLMHAARVRAGPVEKRDPFRVFRGRDVEQFDPGLRVAGTVECSWWPEPAYEAVSAWLATRPHATALICLNDRLAMGAYQAAADAGLRIPQDLSLVGYDDDPLAFGNEGGVANTNIVWHAGRLLARP